MQDAELGADRHAVAVNGGAADDRPDSAFRFRRAHLYLPRIEELGLLGRSKRLCFFDADVIRLMQIVEDFDAFRDACP